MSGQFTESCRTHKGANRNQCRDSLQSLVGPIKELPPLTSTTTHSTSTLGTTHPKLSLRPCSPTHCLDRAGQKLATTAPTPWAGLMFNHPSAPTWVTSCSYSARPRRLCLYKPKRSLRLRSITNQLKPLRSL
ncbi:unnamed protein product [Camellia sinensis]